MKQFITVMLCLIGFGASAQGVSRGSFGTQSNYHGTTMKIAKPVAGTGTLVTADTLTNGDTGYVFIWVGQGFSKNFELLTTTLTGTVATTSNILYGYNNNGSPLSASQAVTAVATAQPITGSTTYCAGCVGASSTTVPGASKKYTWQVPYNGGALFDNYIIRTIQTGTCTATYTGKAVTEY